MSNGIKYINPVVFVGPDGPIQTVGFFKKLKKAFKRAVTLPKKMNSLKDAKKLATIKNITGIVASVALPGIGGALVNVGIAAHDAAKAKKQVKEAAKKAAAADAAAIKQITDSYNALKKESDEFRAKRGLPPLPRTLPDLKGASPDQVEKAFAVLQDDAAALVAMESGQTVNSTAGGTVDPSGKKKGNKNTAILIVGGVAVVGLAAFLLLRKRR